MKKKILITGGTGFIGSHLVKRLKAQGHQISVIDNLSASRKNLPAGVKFYQKDICHPSLLKLFQKIRPEVVYHLAADNRITSSPEETLKTNIIGSFNILHVSKLVNIKHFIFTSSAAVYGESKTFPIKESHPTKPISAYGVSKLTAELYCQLFQPHFPSTIFRFANVYGPGQSSSSEGGVVAIFINQSLKNQRPIIYGSGRQTRDFVYVDDVIDALVLALKTPKNFILNIGSSQPTSILHLFRLIAQLTQRPPRFIKKPKRPVEIQKSLFSHQLATQRLGWRPKTNLTSGLKQTIEYFKSL